MGPSPEREPRDGAGGGSGGGGGLGVGRRAALASLALAAGAWALWPVTPRSRREVPPGRRIVRYWEKWTGPEGAAVQEIVDLFNASQERYWVLRSPVSDLQTKAMVAIGGGDPPDLVGLHSYSVPQYARAGALMPLDELGATPGEPHYAPSVWRLLTDGGRCWAGANTCYTFALYLNRERFRAAGLDPDRPPRTIAGLDAASHALTERGPGGRIERAGFVAMIPGWWPYVWPVMFGGSLFDEAAGRVTLDRPENRRAYAWLGASSAWYGRAEIKAFTSAFARSLLSANDPFLTGRVAMCVQGPWMANFASLHAPGLDYAACELPEDTPRDAGTPPAGLVECDVLAVPRGAREPEGAAAYIAFTQRRDAQELLCARHGKNSPLADVSDDFRATHPNRSLAVHEAIARSPRAAVLPRTPAWKNYSDLLWSMAEAVWDGADAGERVAATHRRAEGLIARATRG
ncbi:MAG: extracellular solute-binding protein [Phycisphaeraceae bacterium]|nr:MAG: extracellular solute-binding protein [Phycisphaeraceae bacterium]